jgi:hypothetical protein
MVLDGTRSRVAAPNAPSSHRTIDFKAFKIEHATFPNWEGVEQKRAFSISGDELKYNVPAASGGGTAELVWKRAK